MTRRWMQLPAKLRLLFGVSFGALQFGCLEEPAEYTAAIRIPPIVNFSEVVPSPSVVQIVESETLSVIVNFRSEDLNDEVIAVMLLDDVPGVLPHVISDQKVPPSTFEYTRELRFDVTDFGGPGCHTLTLLLTHVSNTTAFRFDVLDESLATRVTWMLAVQTAPNEILLSDCPTQGLSGNSE